VVPFYILVLFTFFAALRENLFRREKYPKVIASGITRVDETCPQKIPFVIEGDFQWLEDGPRSGAAAWR
jgi:hypothetical protein